MGIERIIELMPVPNHVHESEGHDWLKVEYDFGTVFPRDYKDFLATYGTGSIGNFLWIINPFSSNKNLNLERMIYLRDSYTEMKKLFPKRFHRNENLILPWAITDNGDSFFWTIDEVNSNNWRVFIHDSDQAYEEETHLRMSNFLEELLENRFISSILPRDFLERDKYFKSKK